MHEDVYADMYTLTYFPTCCLSFLCSKKQNIKKQNKNNFSVLKDGGSDELQTAGMLSFCH